jgi:hypothetical protein
LDSAFLASNPILHAPRVVSKPDAGAVSPGLTEEEEKQVREQLRGLGYL